MLSLHMYKSISFFIEPKDGADSFAPRIVESVKSMSAPDGNQVEFVCKVEILQFSFTKICHLVLKSIA